MGYKPIGTLSDPWWERQPEETSTAYARFVEYRQQQRGRRSLSQVAESLSVKRQTVQVLAKAHRWDERVAAWDQHQTEQHQERITAHAERLAEAEIRAAEEALLLVRRTVRDDLDNGRMLTHAEAPKWADVAIKLGEAALRTPERMRTIYRQAQTHGDGTASAYEVDIPDLEGLSPEARRERVQEMMSGIVRLNQYQQREEDRAS